MAVSLGQLSTLGHAGLAASVTTTFSVNPTAGSKILCAVQGTSVGTNVQCTDNGTTPATWILDASTDVGGEHIHLFRADGITLPSSGTLIVTASFVDSTSHTIGCGALEVIGAVAGAPSSTVVGPTATSASVSTGNITGTSTDSSFYCAAFGNAAGGNPSTVTYTGPGTQQFVETNGSTYWPWACATNIVTGAQSAQNFTWTITSSSWCSIAAVYEAAAVVTHLNRPTLYGTVW